jgi:hypothetical protein
LTTELEKVEERVTELRGKVTRKFLYERDIYKRESAANEREEGACCLRRKSSRRDNL